MSFNATVYITTAGYNLMAGALAGDELQFTRMGVGDGDMPAGVSENQMTALSNEVLSVPVQSIVVENNNVASVKGVITSGDASVAFDFKELGLYATLNGGAEVLVGYGNAGASSEYVDLDTTYSILQKLIDIKIPVSGLATISLSVSAQGYALQSDLVNLQNRVTITENDIATNTANIQTNADAIANINSERVVKKFKTLYEAQRLAKDGDICVINSINANKANWAALCNALISYQSKYGVSLPSTDAFNILDIKDNIILFLSPNNSTSYLVAIQFSDDDFTIDVGCHIEVTDTHPIDATIVKNGDSYYIAMIYDASNGSGTNYLTRVLPFPYGWGDASLPDITWGQMMQTGYCLWQRGEFPLAISYTNNLVPVELCAFNNLISYPAMRRLAVQGYREIKIPYSSFSYSNPLFVQKSGEHIVVGLGNPGYYMSFLFMQGTHEAYAGDTILAPCLYSTITSSSEFSEYFTFLPQGGAVYSDGGTLYTFSVGNIESNGTVHLKSASQSPYQIGGSTPDLEYVSLNGGKISWKTFDPDDAGFNDFNSMVIGYITSTSVGLFNYSTQSLFIGDWNGMGTDDVSCRSLDDLGAMPFWQNSSYPAGACRGLTYIWCDKILEYSENNTPEAIVLFPRNTDGGVYRKSGGVIQYIGESL